MEFISKSGRLDKVLQERLKNTRNQVENFIKNENVKVNGIVVKKCGYQLKGGEKVEYEIQELTKEKEKYEVNFSVGKLYEDEDILVINKPPFLTVHQAPSVKEATLVDWLKKQNISLSTISGEERHGIVHRIDKQTSGALLIAKNNKVHVELSKQLQDKSMGRYYLAVVDLPLKSSIIIDTPIARNRNNRLKMGVDLRGKSAKSAFLKLLTSKNEKYELIAAKLFTGRTHQIRVHLNSLSRHILGDDLYGFKSKDGRIKRVMLHAYLLYFIHPISKQKIVVKAPLFKDFEELLQKKFNMEKIDEKINPSAIIDSFSTCF